MKEKIPPELHALYQWVFFEPQKTHKHNAQAAVMGSWFAAKIRDNRTSRDWAETTRVVLETAKEQGFPIFEEVK
jgi:primase-polymerase (primpol)-like protein